MTDREAELTEELFMARKRIEDLERDKDYYSAGYQKFMQYIVENDLLEAYRAYAVTKRLEGEWN